jgi:cytochrome c553
MKRIFLPLLLGIAIASPAVAQSTAEQMATCLACHGDKGQSELPEVPSLGAQPSPYALIQLVLFREKIRAFDPMNEMLKGAPDGDLQAFADTIAKLPPPAPADGADPARMAKAKTLAHQNRCDICHRPDFSGTENVPRLAGQREDYLVKTLREYKSGTRHGYDASMADVLAPLGDADFIELAYLLAHSR